MANRAYLYASDSEDGDDWTLPEDGEYFDSRWSIPLAWWFLFGPAELKVCDVHFEGSVWQSLRFVSDRLLAIDRILTCRDLLDPVVDEHLDLRFLEYFIAVLSEWPGKYLLLDPDEVFENDPQDDSATIVPVLQDLHRGAISGYDLLSRLSNYSAIKPADRAEVLIVGCTYGQVGHRLWDQIMGSR